jgi:hypothetical protein
MINQTVSQNRIFRPQEIVSRPAALGLRFFDQAFETKVADGLLVTARPLKGARTRPVTAVLNGEGVFAFDRLPGPASDYIIEVWDKFGRFMPMATVITLPVPLAQNPKDYYLFSAPSRPAVTGMGAIRSLLIDQTRNQPAAFALLEASNNGKKWYGVADEHGSVLLNFPYPNFVKSTTNPPSSQKLLINQGWTFTVRAHYRPGALLTLPDAAVPDLRTVLAQSYCIITTKTVPHTDVAQFDVTVQFGQDYVARTDVLPHLLLTPSTSPP